MKRDVKIFKGHYLRVFLSVKMVAYIIFLNLSLMVYLTLEC